MKTWAMLVLLCVCAAAQGSPPDAACGDKYVAFQVIKDRSQHLAPPSAASKAMVYFFGHGMFAMDGKAVGAVSDSYAVAEVDAGEHHVCGWVVGALGPLKFNARSLHSLNAKPGQSYYFDLVQREYYPFTLELVDPDEGRYRISTLPFSTSQIK